MIKLHVAIIKSSSKKPAEDPIVILQGGPGVVALDMMDNWIMLFGKQRAHRDLIILDQRGIGYSQPVLDCPDAKEVLFESYAENLTTAGEEGRYFQYLLGVRKA